MKIDISDEIIFQTARSGGKGGQNVNKVETMVTGRWDIVHAAVVNEKQKALLLSALASRITKDGFLLVKSQTERTQSGNKSKVISKMNMLVNQALVLKTPRIATRPTESARRKRMEHKKRKSELKRNRSQWETE